MFVNFVICKSEIVIYQSESSEPLQIRKNNFHLRLSVYIYLSPFNGKIGTPNEAAHCNKQTFHAE